jgi:osmotically-inducible protein OsmY
MIKSKARLVRALALDGDPLRRASDRAEAWIRAGLLIIFLTAGPIAALAVGQLDESATAAVLASVATLAVTALGLLIVLRLIHNHLMVKLPAGDYRDDAQLTTAANNALTWDVTVPPGVEATARDGNLTLTGTVHFGTERTAAETAVSGLIGLRNVRDEIDISFDADPGDVTAGVQDALDRNALIVDDSDVVVNTDDNTVTLTGHVRTWAEHDAALDVAWMASGVYDVIDNLVITG